MKEPFNIATGALADLNVDAELEILDIGANVSPLDTAKAAQAMRDRGVKVLITLGGDGTNRTIAKVWPDVTLVPMSTGTNNVFPSLVEPTVAGAAAEAVSAALAAATGGSFELFRPTHPAHRELLLQPPNHISSCHTTPRHAITSN
jgi:hypothetical protein